tara:strand:+ start:383 stop:1009 length:627 start_codon:yes stop_codon:yes gene_type:complete
MNKNNNKNNSKNNNNNSNSNINSNNKNNSINITPKIWGPICWNFLYSIAYNYKSKYKDKYFYLLKKLEYILPCPKCIIHLRDYISKESISQQNMSKKYLINWLSKLHESIGGKKQSYKEILKNIGKEDYTDNKNIIIYFIIINNFYLTKKLPIYHFCQIKTFYELMSYLYPDKDIKDKFKKMVKLKSFKDSCDGKSLNDVCKKKLPYF